MLDFRRLLFMTSLLVLMATPLLAAEFKVDPDAQDCQIRLFGAIQKGDLEKLKSKLEPSGLGPGKAGPNMCLNSPGGNFIEGLKLAEFVSGGISTRIQARESCESACAWIFMAGSHFNTDGSEWSRGMDAQATLSFHAPYIDPTSLAGIGSQSGSVTAKAIIQAHGQAVAELGQGLLQLTRQIASTTGDVMVHPTLLAEAMVRVGDNRLLIDTTGDAVRWSIDVGGHTGVIPRSKRDVIRACVVASAFGNGFWNDYYLSSSDAEEYEAYYDSRSRTLVAEMVVSGIAHIACEIEFVFDEQLSGLLGGGFQATINVGSDESITNKWIRDRYASKKISLSDIAILNPKTPLRQLSGFPITRLDPSSLATLSFPSWCISQSNKTSDEKFICENPKLTTYEIFLDRYYRKAIMEGNTIDKTTLQSEQRAWLARRRSCSDDIECIAQAYRSRIAKLK